MMTASDVQAGTWWWKPVPGYFCEVSNWGEARSVDRVLGNGRRVKGTPLSVTISNRGYVLVKVYDHDGVRQTKTMHSLQMLAFEGPCPPGKQVRHWNDIGDDNRWAPGGEAGCRAGLGNLVYGDEKQQWQDKLRNRPEPLVTHRSWARRAVDYAASRLRRRSR